MNELKYLGKIDNFGRIVIPKKIRKRLNVDIGDYLEITSNDMANVNLKQHFLENNLAKYAKDYAKTLYNSIEENVVITDNKTILAYYGEEESIVSGNITEELNNAILKKEVEVSKIKISTKDNCDKKYQVIIPIIAFKEEIGSIVIFSTTNKIHDKKVEFAVFTVEFLSKKLES